MKTCFWKHISSHVDTSDTRDSVSSAINTSNFVKNTPLCVVFSTLFSGFSYPDETLSLVFDYITFNMCNHLCKYSPGPGCSKGG